MTMKLKLRFLVIVSLCLSVVLVVFLSRMTDDIYTSEHHSSKDLSQREGRSFDSDVVVAGHGGHLQVLRKDLDLSNYTEHSPLEEKEAVDFLRKNLLNEPSHRTREYLDRLMKVARDINSDSSRKSPYRKVGINQEFLPEDLNDNLKGPDSLNSNGPTSQEIEPLVELFPQEIQYLEKVRPRRTRPRKIKPLYLGLHYDQPDANLRDRKSVV